MYVDGMPAKVWRLHTYELEQWCDGREHVLRPGVDFPPDLDVKVIKQRLIAAAKRRAVHVQVWFLDGAVHFVMWNW
jgi:hypothetical protein